MTLAIVPARGTTATFVLAALAPLASAQLSAPVPLPGDLDPAPLAGSQYEPRVAASDTTFLAVWSDERAALETTVELDPWEVVQSEVWAQRLDATGAPIDAAPIRVDGSPYSQVTPAVASNGTDWLVAFESRSVATLGTYTTQDLRAVRVSAAGAVLDATPLVIDTSDGEAYAPTVASDGSGWAVFWTDASKIYARAVAADGTVGATRVVAEGLGWVFDPEATFAGDRYLVTWEGSGVTGRFLDANLDPLGGAFSISTGGADPRVATDGTDFFVTISIGSSWPEVRGTVVRADGTVLDPGGVNLDGPSYLAGGFPAVTWDGSAYVVAWSEWRYVWPVGPEEKLQFTRVDANGVTLFPTPMTLVLSTAFSVREPVAASLGNGAFLGWLDDRNGTLGHFDGFGTIVDATGSAPPERAFMESAPAQIHADLAWGPTGATLADDVNLAVFVSADSSETRVVVQRLDGHGTPLDPEPIVVAGGKDTYREPGAVWNGTLWLVVWEDSRGGTGNGGALAARVLPDGTVLDATPIAVLDGNDPAVGALSVVDGDFLVAATKRTSGDIRTLYGRRVGSDGTLLDGSPLFLGANFALAPTVAGFDDRWVALWHRKPTHDTPSSTLQARLVSATGVVGPLLDPSSSTADEMVPDVAVAGDVATFAWSDGTDIRVRQMHKEGTFLGSAAGVVVSAAANEQTAPTVCTDGAKTVVTWVDDRIHGIFEPGVGDLFGARLDASLMVLEPNGVAIAADPEAPEGEAGLVGRMGVTTTAVPAVLDAFGTWRVATTTWRDWTRMGSDLPGTGGPPRLWMTGLLTAGSQVAFEVTDALPLTLGYHVIGFTAANLPFQGGTLVPSPDVLLAFTTNAQGARTKTATLTSALPAGTELYVQTWLFDAAGPMGSSATEAFESTSP